tara:strand:- start:753 stop:1550 length:798 start_codon:yes stop_codon:yes gene_type:complete
MAQNGNNNTGGGGEGSPYADPHRGDEAAPQADPNAVEGVEIVDFEEGSFPTQGTEEWERPTQTVAPEIYNEEDYIMTWDLSDGSSLEVADSIPTVYSTSGYTWPTNAPEASTTWKRYDEQEFHPPILTRATVQALTLTTDGTDSSFRPRVDSELPISQQTDASGEKTLWYLSDLTAHTGGGGATSLSFSDSAPSYGDTTLYPDNRSLDEAKQLSAVAGYVASRSLTTIISDHITDIINAGFPIVPDVGNQIVNTIIKHGRLKDKS